MRAIVFRIFFISQVFFCLPLCSSEFPSLLSICEVKKTGGLGTKANPFWICDYAGLNNIRNNLASSHILLADIDASSTCGGSCSHPSPPGWLSIGYSITTGSSVVRNLFTGQFNGNSHTISNLYLSGRPNVSSIPSAGLFDLTNGAEIRELGLVNIKIVSMGNGDGVGGLVARPRSSRIIRCYTTGSVSFATTTITTSSGDNEYGGLVGEMQGSRIINSYSEVNIDGVNGALSTRGGNYGGLIGKASSITLSSPPVHSFVIGSYATGNIMADGDAHGGLVGEFTGGGDVIGSYATGNITGTGTNASHGGLIGKFDGGGTITNSYAEGKIEGDGNYYGGLVGNFAGGGDITNSHAKGNIIGDGPNHGGLVGLLTGGTVANSYATGEIEASSTMSSNHYGGLIGKATSTSSSPPVHSFVIGSYATGNIMGNGGRHGGLVGDFDGEGTITNSYAKGNITGNGNNCGGLIGKFNGRGMVTNSYATGDITGNGNNCGGLVGNFSGIGSVIGSHATGNIISNGASHGGLIGKFNGRDRVANSYATGNIMGNNVKYGGLIGEFTGGGDVIGSYATGNITGTGINASHGGLIGEFTGGGDVIGSYATGDITGNGEGHGGLIGDFDGGGTVANSYATGDITGSGKMISSTGGHGGLVGRMKGGGVGGVLQNNYASGNVTAVGAGTSVVYAYHYGGLVGEANGSVTNNYATGNVNNGSLALASTSTYGGLIGFFTGSKLENSYYAIGTVVAGSIAGDVVGLQAGTQMTGLHYFESGVVTATGIGNGVMCTACRNGNIRGITSSTAPGAWSTGSTQWDLDYGNSSQLPAIKHVQNPDPPSLTQPRWCSNPGSSNLSGLSACGSIISGQR